MRLIKDDKDIFVGFFGIFKMNNLLYDTYKRANIKGFKAVLEIRHKDWERLGLVPPLEPDKQPAYEFNNMRIQQYYTIWI